MAQNPRQFRIKHFNHPLVHLKVTDLLGFLFHFQAQQTHFIKLNEASTGSFCISIYKLPLVIKRRREGDSRFLPCASRPPPAIPVIPLQARMSRVEQAQAQGGCRQPRLSCHHPTATTALQCYGSAAFPRPQPISCRSLAKSSRSSH